MPWLILNMIMTYIYSWVQHTHTPQTLHPYPHIPCTLHPETLPVPFTHINICAPPRHFVLTGRWRTIHHLVIHNITNYHQVSLVVSKFRTILFSKPWFNEPKNFTNFGSYYIKLDSIATISRLRPRLSWAALTSPCIPGGPLSKPYRPVAMLRWCTPPRMGTERSPGPRCWARLQHKYHTDPLTKYRLGSV